MHGFNIALISAVAAAAASFAATTGSGQPSRPPSLEELQAAYEKEATGENAKKHDLGLKLWESDCRPTNTKGFACSVSFFSASDPEKTLYMDIALVEPQERGWRLKSGLCRR